MTYPPYMNAAQRRRARRLCREMEHVTPKNAKDIGAAFMLNRAMQMLKIQAISEQEHLGILMGGGTMKVGLGTNQSNPLH